MSAYTSVMTRGVAVAEPARLEISWPGVRAGRGGGAERLVWRIALLAGPEGARVISAEGGWGEEAPLVARAGACGLTLVGAELWHVDVPGMLAATFRVREGREPELLYARTALLGDQLTPGSLDRPTLVLTGWGACSTSGASGY